MELNARAILARWRLAAIVGVVVLAGAIKAFSLTNNKGYMPDQPIAFSHKLHAGKLQMNCLYCHSNAEKSRHASVPPMDTCMGCHSVVRTDRPAIQELTKHWQAGAAVPWTRVWSLPDHVYFSHKNHVAAGVACQTCHGPVETMDIISQVVDFSMGWCIQCHRNDEYIKTPAKQAAFGDAPGLTPEERERFESIKSAFWDENDLERVSSEGDPRTTAKLVTQALGYNSLAPQTGKAPAVDHVKAFQNAPILCSTCHQ
ncbi:cytochrome c3 family protein [Candidatus Poribacteria bacterium]|nr:cytochrome c3 family protein [Candidatus Poribacteria bacterium]